jgi:restriction system protein
MGTMLIISNFIPMLLVLLPIIFIIYLLKSPWFKGIAGEFIVHILLKIQLDRNDYYILKDATLPTPGGSTQIDHIIVSKFGVFVIETKNMKGWIFGGAHQKTWTQKIYNYTNKFQNPLHQNYKHVETLRSILGLNDQQIISVIAFVGESTFKTVMPENVTYGNGCVRYIKSKTRILIADEDVKKIITQIESGRLVPSSETNMSHIKHVKQLITDKHKGKGCPKCGSPMVVRVARKGPNSGNKFLGCTKFPQCRGASPIPLEKEESEISFTDSWKKSLDPNDDFKSDFTNRAFQ